MSILHVYGFYPRQFPQRVVAKAQRGPGTKAHIHQRQIPRQQIAGLMQNNDPLNGLNRRVFRQQNALIIVQNHIPTPLSDTHQTPQTFLDRGGRCNDR